MATSNISTGGVKPLRIGGKITLRIKDCGGSLDGVGRYTCSVYGWKRDYVVGDGDTMQAAVADWCKATGNDFGETLAECHFVDGDGCDLVIE